MRTRFAWAAAASFVGLGCGPSLNPSSGAGGTGSAGSEGSTSDASASGAIADGSTSEAVDTTGAVAACGLEHTYGSLTTLEIVNNRAAPVIVEGTTCGAPLQMTRNDAEVLWQWDCDIPVCPTEPDQGCWICDCDPGSALLDPGESTEYAWDGIEFSEIDPPVGCDDCGSCLLAAPPPPGEYTLTVRFREACVDPDPLACDEDAPLQLASVKFDYPTDTVVLPIE